MRGHDRNTLILLTIGVVYALAFTLHLPTLPFLAKALLSSESNHPTTRSQPSSSWSSSSDGGGWSLWSMSDSLRYGMVLGGYSLTKIVSSPVWGHASDVFGRIPILVTVLSGTGVSLLLCGLSSSLNTLIAARMATGLFASCGAVLTTLLYEIAVPDTTHPRPAQSVGSASASAVALLSAFETAWKIAYFIAPILLYALSEFNPKTPLFLSSGLFFVSAGLALCLDRGGGGGASRSRSQSQSQFHSGETEKKRHHPTFTLASFVGGIRHSFGHPLLGALVFAGLISPTKDMAPLMASKFGSGPSQVASTDFVRQGLSLLVSASPAAAYLSTRHSQTGLILGGLVLQGILFAGYPHSISLGVFFALNAGAACVAAIVGPIEHAYLSSLASRDSLGTFIGVTHAIKGLTRFASTLLAAYLSGASSLSHPFYIGAVGLVVKGLLIYGLS